LYEQQQVKYDERLRSVRNE